MRILKGHPGSGKTTALLHAADSAAAESVLYVTYSRDLAALARQHFDRFCSSSRRFHVVTFDNFVRQLINQDVPQVPESELRRRFQSDLYPFARNWALGPSTCRRLYDEVHAHLVGAALPIDVLGRFEACREPRVSDRHYKERRSRFLGAPAAAAALDAASRLERSASSPSPSVTSPSLRSPGRRPVHSRSRRGESLPSSSISRASSWTSART